MTHREGFYCFNASLDSWINDPLVDPEPAAWEDARPLITIEQCQLALDLNAELSFFYLGTEGRARRDLIPVPLFPSLNLPATSHKHPS